MLKVQDENANEFGRSMTPAFRNQNSTKTYNGLRGDYLLPFKKKQVLFNFFVFNTIEADLQNVLRFTANRGY